MAVKEAYNSDPMDQPDESGERGEGATIRWGRETEVRVLSTPEPAFTWAKIREDAKVEYTARITEFHLQKNSRMVDWMLSNLHRNDNLPDDLLAKTQAYTASTHPLEVKK